MGVKMTHALAANELNEKFNLGQTDLIGTRNANQWEAALSKMKSLNKFSWHGINCLSRNLMSSF